ncbi:MAG: peptide chain release factor 1 [Candidatus Hydrogenedentota bacterium]|nr:MAG: peptide chain release factor 1 [Candidatus Hydrogenedentota bacterium]
MEPRAEHILEQHAELERSLSDPAVQQDYEKMRKLLQKKSELDPIVQSLTRRKEVQKQMQEIKHQLEQEKEAEIKQMLKEEFSSLEKEADKLNHDIKIMLLPKDPDDGKNMIVEIRAGTGGEEAALFARDLFRMYLRFLDKKKVPYEILSETQTGLDGLKEAVFLAKGPLAYRLLHLEAGTHRVQRIPETESQGRIHTSAVTVAVMPEAEEADVEINPDEIRVDVFRASGAGGQHVNRTESAVRLTHIPTGIVVTCQDEKSQHKNKAKAMAVLRARILDKLRSEEHAQRAKEKKAQVGSGDRSERIRTYNFPQNRITDHRIGYTAYNLDQVMEGDLDELIDALLAEETRKKMELTA